MHACDLFYMYLGFLTQQHKLHSSCFVTFLFCLFSSLFNLSKWTTHCLLSFFGRSFQKWDTSKLLYLSWSLMATAGSFITQCNTNSVSLLWVLWISVSSACGLLLLDYWWYGDCLAARWFFAKFFGGEVVSSWWDPWWQDSLVARWPVIL